MFRYLIVLAEVVVLVALLRSSFAQYLLMDTQRKLSGWMTDITLTLEKTQLDDLRHSLAPYTGQMRDFQKDYLMEVTQSTQKLTDFYRKYCMQGEINPYVNGSNLSVVCSTIDNSKLVQMELKNS